MNSLASINVRVLFIIISYILYGIILISIPFRRSKISKKAGTIVMEIEKSSILSKIVIYIFALALISVIWIRDFGAAMNFVMCGCGVLACELMTRDVALYKKYGIYEKAIVYDGAIIPYDTIIGFPVLKLPQEDQLKYDSKTLVIQTATKGTKSFTFRSEEEYKIIVQKLFELNPEYNKMI